MDAAGPEMRCPGGRLSQTGALKFQLHTQVQRPCHRLSEELRGSDLITGTISRRTSKLITEWRKRWRPLIYRKTTARAAARFYALAALFAMRSYRVKAGTTFNRQAPTTGNGAVGYSIEMVGRRWRGLGI